MGHAILPVAAWIAGWLVAGAGRPDRSSRTLAQSTRRDKMNVTAAPEAVVRPRPTSDEAESVFRRDKSSVWLMKAERPLSDVDASIFRCDLAEGAKAWKEKRPPNFTGC